MDVRRGSSACHPQAGYASVAEWDGAALNVAERLDAGRAVVPRVVDDRADRISHERRGFAGAKQLPQIVRRGLRIEPRVEVAAVEQDGHAVRPCAIRAKSRS